MNIKSQEITINDSIVDTAFNEEQILNLLEMLNISPTGNINVNKEITHTPINKSIIIEIPNEGCIGENRIMLTVKQGQPTVDQVYQSVYQNGSDCHQRIIIFTGGSILDDKYNPSADVDTVKCLVEAMNRFGHEIHLVKLVHDSTSSTCDHEILAQPDSPCRFWPRLYFLISIIDFTSAIPFLFKNSIADSVFVKCLTIFLFSLFIGLFSFEMVYFFFNSFSNKFGY